MEGLRVFSYGDKAKLYNAMNTFKSEHMAKMKQEEEWGRSVLYTVLCFLRWLAQVLLH